MANIHDRIVERFLTEDHGRFLGSSLGRVWILKEDKCVHPVSAKFQTCISDKFGVTLVAFFNPREEIVTANIASKPDKAYILLADDYGFITDISSNFKNKFVGKNCDILNEDLKVNIYEIFQGLNQYSADEL